jgi:Flp pilus assembly protein CpaB
MKGGSKLFIFAGLALALVAIVLGIASFSGNKTGAQNKAADTKVTVVEALKDVPAHTVLTATDLIEKQVPSSEAVDGPVSSVGLVIGQSYSVKLTAGQRLQSALVEVPGVANSIKPGLRAMALPVTSVSSLGGLVQDDNYVDIVFHARINLERIVNSTLGDLPEDGDFKADKPAMVDPSTPAVYPAAGDAGSIFQVRDGVGDDGQLEPVAKIVLQDIHVLRVLGPGQSFNADGSVSAAGATTDVQTGSQNDKLGQLIVEVTPQQAELVTFIQDPKQSYQVTVRAKGDHTNVSTTGITYEILVDSATWNLPYPKSITSPGGTPVVVQTPAANAGKGGSLKGNGADDSGNSSNGSSGGNGAGV